MAKNGVISGSKKVKSGRKLVDFTVKITVRHGGERGYAQIPHTHQHSFTLINTVSHTIAQFYTRLHPSALACSAQGILW